MSLKLQQLIVICRRRPAKDITHPRDGAASALGGNGNQVIAVSSLPQQPGEAMFGAGTQGSCSGIPGSESLVEASMSLDSLRGRNHYR